MWIFAILVHVYNFFESQWFAQLEVGEWRPWQGFWQQKVSHRLLQVGVILVALTFSSIRVLSPLMLPSACKFHRQDGVTFYRN